MKIPVIKHQNSHEKASLPLQVHESIIAGMNHQAIVQTKVQEMVNGSSRIEKQKVYQHIANISSQIQQASQLQAIANRRTASQQPNLPISEASPILQLAIDRNKLNLVGEDHDEQDETLQPENATVRTLEKKMLKEEYGFEADKYWLEYKFEYEDQKTDKTIKGDPPVERMKYGIGNAIANFYNLEQTYDRFLLSRKDDALLKKDMKAWLDNLKFETIMIEVDLKTCEPFTTTRNVNVVRGGFNSPLVMAIDAMIQSIEHENSMQSTHGIYKGMKKIKPMIERLKRAGAYRGDIYDGNGFKGIKNRKEELSMTRSSHMLKAANKSGEEKGIWKIGDDHAKEIKKHQGQRNFPVKEEKVEITLLADFDPEEKFQNWPEFIAWREKSRNT